MNTLSSDFTLNYDLDLLSKEISRGLAEQHSSAIHADKTEFWGENSRYQTDSYRIYSALERGLITVNVHFFQKAPSDGSLHVKVSVFPPVKETSLKGKELLKEIGELISVHTQ